MARRKTQSNLGSVVLPSDMTLKGQFNLATTESPEEQTSRLRIEEAEAAHRRRQEIWVLGAVLITVAIAVGISLWVIVGLGYSAENMKWATTLLTSIISAGIGYVTGKASRSD